MFEFAYGACNTFQSVGILLCWGRRVNENSVGMYKECYSIDVVEGNLQQKNHSSSGYSHHKSSLASYKGFPFVTGGYDGLKTEIYRFDWTAWIEKPDFPAQYTSPQSRYVKYNRHFVDYTCVTMMEYIDIIC